MIRLALGLAVALSGCRASNPAFVTSGTQDGGPRSGDAPAGAGDAAARRPVDPDAGAAPGADGRPSSFDARTGAGDAPAALADTRPPAAPDTAAPVDARGSEAAAAPDAPPRDAATEAADPPPPDLTSGLIGYWKLDEPSGSARASDSSGSGNHGTLEALDPAQAWVPSGRPGGGGALHVPLGSRLAGVRVPDSPSFDGLSRELTVAGWAYRTAQGTSVVSTVISRQLGDGTYDLFHLAFRYDVPVVYFPPEPGGGPLRVLAPRGVEMSTWVHVAATFDGAAVRLYVNGKEVAQAPCTQALPRGGNPIYIGNNRNGPGGNDEPFVGRLDEIVLYNRALPAAAVAALAAGASPR
jgi:hypothetical protein